MRVSIELSASQTAEPERDQMNRTTYAFENARAVQPERLRLLAALLDDGTFRLLESLVCGRGGAAWR